MKRTEMHKQAEREQAQEQRAAQDAKAAATAAATGVPVGMIVLPNGMQVADPDFRPVASASKAASDRTDGSLPLASLQMTGKLEGWQDPEQEAKPEV